MTEQKQKQQGERERRLAARNERIKALMPPQVRTVRVEATKDDYRKYLKHPRGGGFPQSGAADWPDDRFTRRRIAEGAVKLAEEKHEPDEKPHHHRRHRASDEETHRASDEETHRASDNETTGA